MLDWMSEVTSSYKFTNKTYFDGVSLMDRYFYAEKESLSPNRLHITGIMSMLIASKMEEVYPLKIRTVFEKIGHRKLPMQELLEMESKIMLVLDCKLNTWGFFDLITLKLAQYSNSKQKGERRQVLGERRQVLGELYSVKMNSEFCKEEAKDGKDPQEDELKKM